MVELFLFLNSLRAIIVASDPTVMRLSVHEAELGKSHWARAVFQRSPGAQL